MWDFFSTHDVHTLAWGTYPSGTPHVTIFPWSADLYLGPSYGRLMFWVWVILVIATLRTTLTLVRSATAPDDL